MDPAREYRQASSDTQISTKALPPEPVGSRWIPRGSRTDPVHKWWQALSETQISTKHQMWTQPDPAAPQTDFAGSFKRKHDFAIYRLSDPVGSRQDPAHELRDAISEKQIRSKSVFSDPVGARHGSHLFCRKPCARMRFRASAPTLIYITK